MGMRPESYRKMEKSSFSVFVFDRLDLASEDANDPFKE